jgi:aspartyl-tRNA(Asn)/glutamyl-tRNA(Gln) amidotransferase subunit A
MSLITEHTIRELRTKLDAGDISVDDLVAASQDAVSNREKTVNAFVEVFNDTQPQNTTGILGGIPFANKDNILEKGRVSSAGSKILENYKATYDAKVIELLREAGAFAVGRANMDEFAMGSSTETSAYGITRNPLDESRVPGGSSGGSAAAVAAGMASFALGSDTGGSIRQPAAYCGLVGMKPSYGSVSRRGLIALASSLDVIGPITRTVEDAQTVFDVISEYDEMDSTCVPESRRQEFQSYNENNKIIGVPRSFLEIDGIDPEVLDNFDAELKKLEKQGYTIKDITIPLIENSLAVYYVLQPAEASSNLARFDGIRYGFNAEADNLLDTYLNTKTEGFGSEVKRRIMLGTHVLSSGYHDEYYYKAVRLRDAITQEINKIFDEIDIIATPTSPGVAFPFGGKKDPVSMYLEDIFTVPYNLSGHPAISVPSGMRSQKLPLGMHFTAPLFCEKKLFEVATDFENRN